MPIVKAENPSSLSAKPLPSECFPNQDAVNHHFMWTDPIMKFIPDFKPERLRIVGIAADVDNEHLVAGPAPAIYHPFGQFPILAGRLFFHTQMDPYALVSPITRAFPPINRSSVPPRWEMSAPQCWRPTG